jgi:O-Antigen ligase
MVEDEPLLGTGAGSFRRRWYQDRAVPQPARDAHSLYLETLAELGPLGLVLLGVGLAAPFAARRWAWTPVAIAPYAAYLIHAGQDWDWELPGVTIAALACGAALLKSSTGPHVPRAFAVLAAVLCAVSALGLLGNRAVADATAASDRAASNDAEDAARLARSLQPWSPEPWRLLGEAQLAEGRLEAARRSFRRGLDKDSAEWELWLDLGLAAYGPARQHAFERAARLNPLSPELKELGFSSR